MGCIDVCLEKKRGDFRMMQALGICRLDPGKMKCEGSEMGLF